MLARRLLTSSYMAILGAGVAVMACGDDDGPSGRDARPSDARPSDARPSDARPSDARPSDARPSDARPSDARPSDARPSDARPSDAAPSDAAPPCQDDPLEDNDTSAAAVAVPYTGNTSPVPDELFVHGSQTARLCSGDEDWHFIETSFGQQTTLLKLRALAAGAGLCGASCDQYVPPAGPQSTVTVEVYSATTMALLGSSTSDVGRVRMSVEGAVSDISTLEVYEDVFVRIYGPPEAVYEYELRFILTTSNYEDECEC